MQFLDELKRRKVIRVGVAYVVGGWLLLQFGDVIIGLLSLPDWTGRALVAAIVAGLPVAIVFSWIYDWTRKGIVVTAPAAESPDAATAVNARDETKIVAVLPFVNRSLLPEDAFFADGVHDELLTQISKLSAIQVISRTSVMRYRDTSLPIPKIAAELNAAAILEGAVQRSGTRVRINVQLIDGNEDTHLWAETFDRELTPESVFDIQAEITRLIASTLHAVLSGKDEAALDKAAPTRSLVAYDAYLHGTLLARSEAAGETEFRQAIEAFDKAIAADPDFADPHAGKARAELTLYWFYGWDRNWVTAAQLSVDRAKTLSPDSIATLLAEAYYHYWGELDYEKAEDALNRVLAKAPNNAEAWACKAYLIRRVGRFTESIAALEKARQLNPMLVDIPMELATTLAQIGRLNEANAMMEQVVALDPDSAFTAYYAGDVNYLQGRADLAWRGANHPVTEPDFVYYYRRAFHALHTKDPAKMAHAIDDWDEAFHFTPAFPLTYELYCVMVFSATQRTEQAQALLAQITDRVNKNPALLPKDWRPDAPYFPVTLPGLRKDLKTVRRAIKDYEKNAQRDDMGKINHYHAIATALVQAGDRSGALDYLERLITLFGHATFLPVTITQDYDVLAEEPRYLAMRSAYEEWARAHGY